MSQPSPNWSWPTCIQSPGFVWVITTLVTSLLHDVSLQQHWAIRRAIDVEHVHLQVRAGTSALIWMGPSAVLAAAVHMGDSWLLI
jgi:hypothetical protein